MKYIVEDIVEDIVECYEIFGSYFFGAILVITSPLWILPYMIWKK